MSDFDVLPDETKASVFQTINDSGDVLFTKSSLDNLRSYGTMDSFFETHDLAASIPCGGSNFEYYVLSVPILGQK